MTQRYFHDINKFSPPKIAHLKLKKEKKQTPTVSQKLDKYYTSSSCVNSTRNGAVLGIEKKKNCEGYAN
jgi:hypothetical protein